AIRDMRLQRLTGRQGEKIANEDNELAEQVEAWKDLLANRGKVLRIIREELTGIKGRYRDQRRTPIASGGADFIEGDDLIPEETVGITLTHRGYVKRWPASTYRTQNRGGRGIQGMGTEDDDFVGHLVSTSTHDSILVFTNKGKVYRA